MENIITLALPPPAVLNLERQQYTYSNSSSQARQLCPGLLCVWVTHTPRETIVMKIQQRGHMPV